MALTRRFDLSGGVQIKSNKYLMKPNQLLRAQNVIGETVGSLTKRLGYTQIGAQITASKDILMNFEFQYGVTPTRKHIVALNTDLYVWSGSAWTAQSQSLTADAKGRGTDFVDYFFYANYSDATRSYSGSAWSTSTNVTSAPKAKFVESYRNRLYLGYGNVSSTAYPSRVYYSSLPDSSQAITWDTDNDYFDVETEDGDVLTALAKNKIYLLVFKEGSMHRYDGTTGNTSLRPISWNLGAVSQESVVVDENIVLAYSRKGVTMYRGSKPEVISRPVQPFIDRVNQANLGDICAGIHGDHYLCYIGTLTSALPGDSAALTNVVLDYDIPQNLWTYHTIPDAIKVFSNYTSSGAKLLSLGDSNGEVFTWDSGTTDDGTDIATNIELVMWPNGPEVLTTLQNIFFFGNSSLGDLSYKFAVDGGDYSTANSLSANYAQKHFGDATIKPYGRELKIQLSEADGTNQWRIDGISVEHEVSTQTDVKED